MYSQLVTLLGILTVGLLSPGPDFFLIVKNSMSGSRARAFATGWGIAAGLTVQVLALSLGLAVAPPIVLRCIQVAGAVVLAWIGLKALLARPEPKPDSANKPADKQADKPVENPAEKNARDDGTASTEANASANAGASASAGASDSASVAAAAAAAARQREHGQAATGFMEGFLCNATNVKVFVFFVSLFSQFIRPDSSLGWHVFVPVVVVIHGAVMWTLINWALMFPPVARQLARAQRWLPRAFGVILIAFAIFVVCESLFMG